MTSRRGAQVKTRNKYKNFVHIVLPSFMSRWSVGSHGLHVPFSSRATERAKEAME
jgi:hypothetical protein